MKLAFCALIVAASAGVGYGALLGSADLTSTPLGGGQFQDAISVHNTGTTPIGTFWFSWIPGEDFLTTPPTALTAPAGWTATPVHVVGYSIEWTANSPATYITAGSSLSGFGFHSDASPATLAGPSPIDARYREVTSFFYIGPAFGDPGLQFDVQVVPAPAGLGLIGLAGITTLRRRR